jgi:UDP-N-acetylglucosamine--N-acetylmuramyl-(pentapeptide) pyrophosphoryl-undecaprenol N-acetylglucosamine transferase
MSAEAAVMILAGGTGGHIFPGLAVAAELRARGVPVVWLGSSHGLENRLVPAAGIHLDTIKVSGLRGKGALALLTAPLRLLRSLWQAARILRRQRPRCVLSLGGFAAGPAA